MQVNTTTYKRQHTQANWHSAPLPHENSWMDWDFFRTLLGRLIQEQNLNDNTLAERCGVPQPTISRFRNGTSKTMDLENVHAIAKALGITVSQAIGETALRPSLQRQRAFALMEEMPEYQVARAVKILDALAEPDDGNAAATG